MQNISTKKSSKLKKENLRNLNETFNNLFSSVKYLEEITRKISKWQKRLKL